jgi:tRNA A-37 threonylcarbamoyl transferase component Bud32/Tol biopolymer transport system component
MAAGDDSSFLRQLAGTPERPPPEAPPERLGRFRVLEAIGKGGMGVVYRARDEQLNRDVAIKLLPERNPDRLRRFATEAKAAAALSHPNVLQVFDVDVDGDRPYIVTELLEGKTLAALLGEGRPPLKRALELATQFASGLAAAHARGIIHRDLKPSNLFVTRDGTLKILDFGLAKVVEPISPHGETKAAHEQTRDGVLLGTVGYMAPEQVEGRPADARSDLFAFGCVLYEMLSGARAFDGPTQVEISYKILRAEPATLPDEISPSLGRVVERLLEKDPERRFQSARDLGFALEGLDDAPPVARRRPARSRRPLLFAAGAVVLALAGTLAGRALVPRTPELRYTQLTYRMGALAGARFAPDGASVVYSMTANDHAQVFSAIPGNREARPLAAGARLAGVSSKGELALILTDKATRGVLARAPLAGGSPRPIADDVMMAAWAPNGDDLMVVRSGGGKHRLEYPMGHLLVESDGWRLMAQPSPVGAEVALVEYRVPSYTIGAVEVVDGQGKRRVLTRRYHAVGNSLVWRPDGREIWFTADDDEASHHTLRAVTLDGHERVVASFPVDLEIRDLAADGRALLSVETFHHRLAGVIPGCEYERDLSWFEGSDQPELSADGKLLLSTVMGQTGELIYLRDGDKAVELGTGTSMAISPDGKWVLAGTGAHREELELLPTGTGVSRKLPSRALDLVTRAFFFPDGKRIAFVGREASKPLRIWTQELAGGEPQPFSDEGTCTSAGPSPDGEWIAAFTHDKHAVLLSTHGKPARPLPMLDEKDLPIAWSATGLYVRRLDDVERLDGYVSTGMPVKIDHVDLQSGARTHWRDLVPGEPAGRAHVDNVAIARDGRAYAYAYGSFSSTLFLVEGLR